VLVASAAASALGDDQTVIRSGKVVDQLAGIQVVKRGAHRHLQGGGVAVETGTVGAHAVLAALRLVLRVIAEVDQRVMALRADHDYVAAAPAIAARRAAAGDELLPPEGHAAVAAVASLDSYLCFIDEHRDRSSAFSYQRSVRPGVHCRPQNEDAVFPVYRTWARIACNYTLG